MKKVIHKFPLEHGGPICLPLLGHLIPRHADDQLGQHCAWIELDADEQYFDLEVVKVATGQPLPAAMYLIYLGTVIEYGMNVWHYYARRAEPARRMPE
jgi:hypothetical protein